MAPKSPVSAAILKLAQKVSQLQADPEKHNNYS
jgi:hypothetical protein